MKHVKLRQGSFGTAGWFWLVALGFFVATGPAQAQDSQDSDEEDSTPVVEDVPVDEVASGQSPHTISYRSLFAARLNPLGLSEEFTASYRYRLYESDSPALEDNFIGVSVIPYFSPAYLMVGGAIEVQPLSILKLWARYDWANYFGTFEYFQSFDNAEADYSDSELERLSEEETNYSTTGTQLTLGALVQLKVGPVAVRNTFRAILSDFDTRDSEPVFYDPTYDVLAPNEGWLYTNDSDLLYLTDFGLIAGVRHTITWAHYDSQFLSDASDDDPNAPNHRLGPLLAYTFFESDEPTAFDKPTVLLIANWYLNHRFRTGEDVSQAMPYLVLGFAFGGNLY